MILGPAKVNNLYNFYTVRFKLHNFVLFSAMLLLCFTFLLMIRTLVEVMLNVCDITTAFSFFLICLFLKY